MDVKTMEGQRRMVEPLSGKNFPEVISVWEASVRATHDFLPETDLLAIRAGLENGGLEGVDLYGIRIMGRLAAFLGVNSTHVEMLFVYPFFRDRGLGRELMEFASGELGTRTVDVNEQNQQAVEFYHKLHYVTIGRDECDPDGRPYPILHLQLNR